MSDAATLPDLKGGIRKRIEIIDPNGGGSIIMPFIVGDGRVKAVWRGHSQSIFFEWEST
jgi:hypothetical protein